MCYDFVLYFLRGLIYISEVDVICEFIVYVEGFLCLFVGFVVLKVLNWEFEIDVIW